ncbi:hypothetical protein B9R42_23210 [Arthrospira platensis PCC 7345]
MGEAKRNPTKPGEMCGDIALGPPNKVMRSLWVRRFVVVRRLGEAKRNPTKPGEMCGDIALGPPNKGMRSLWVRGS